jgi:hypothetical protein
MDGGSEPIGDQAGLAHVRRQALAVHVKSFIAALVLAGIWVFVY